MSRKTVQKSVNPSSPPTLPIRIRMSSFSASKAASPSRPPALQLRRSLAQLCLLPPSKSSNDSRQNEIFNINDKNAAPALSIETAYSSPPKGPLAVGAAPAFPPAPPASTTAALIDLKATTMPEAITTPDLPPVPIFDSAAPQPAPLARKTKKKPKNVDTDYVPNTWAKRCLPPLAVTTRSTGLVVPPSSPTSTPPASPQVWEYSSVHRLFDIMMDGQYRYMHPSQPDGLMDLIELAGYDDMYHDDIFSFDKGWDAVAILTLAYRACGAADPYDLNAGWTTFKPGLLDETPRTIHDIYSPKYLQDQRDDARRRRITGHATPPTSPACHSMIDEDNVETTTPPSPPMPNSPEYTPSSPPRYAPLSPLYRDCNHGVSRAPTPERTPEPSPISMPPKAAFDYEDRTAVYGGLQRSMSLTEKPKFIELYASDSDSDISDMDTSPDDGFDYNTDYVSLLRSDTTTVPSHEHVECHGCIQPPRKRRRHVQFAD